MQSTSTSPLLDPALRDRVLERFDLSSAPAPDLDGLRRLYAAWCRSVPFDNVRKTIALRTTAAAPLPGGHAEDFFESWLADGVGGTCWPTSNGLHALLVSLGFDARRVAGSMFDLGSVNHGSVKVRLDGRDWLADSSFLTVDPLPLTTGIFVRDDPVFAAEVEADGGTHVFWSDFPPNTEYLNCRVLADPVDHHYCLSAYEGTRVNSVFNRRLYARVNRPGELVVLSGRTRYSKTVEGLRVTELSADELQRALHDDIGLSEALIERWVASGVLDASMQPSSGPPPPPSDRRPPSRRAGIAVTGVSREAGAVDPR